MTAKKEGSKAEQIQVKNIQDYYVHKYVEN